MGNSLLDVVVFGRNAGKNAAARAKDVTVGRLTLEHIEMYDKELKEADVKTDMVSPKLLPKYTKDFKYVCRKMEVK